jgi:glycerol-3-phosphate acyltransferase PlsY
MAFQLGLIFIGYLCGSIPFGVIIARRFYGIDIREHGSRNTGATNVWRVLGKKPGIITLLLDALKGIIPVVIARVLFRYEPGVGMWTGLAAILGHNWSIFLRGKGGKGVATSAGVFFALVPLQMLVALAAFGGFFWKTKHVSVGSMAGAVALLVASFAIHTPTAIRLLVLVASILILVKHVPNMKRLARGEEPKVNI